MFKYHVSLILIFVASSSFSGENLLRKKILNSVRQETIQLADSFLNVAPITVTTSVCERSAGGKHEFYSEGDYWWPDPQDPSGPYIRRDGETNPGNFSDHRLAMQRLNEVVSTLTSAWLLTDKAEYAARAAKHLNAWFVDTATMMNPDMLYAQAIWGRFTGRGIGIIDAYHLVEVARSVQVLASGQGISSGEAQKIKAWFAAFLKWMMTHPYGIEEMNAKNNHGTCWFVTASMMAVLTENEEVTAFCRDRFKTILLPGQMAADGSFPLELSRTKPFGYSLFNMDAMANLAQILSTPEDNLWNFTTGDGRSLQKGMDFIYPFIQDKEKWPFAKDIFIWNEWPVRQTSMLFAGLAFQNPAYINVYLKQPAQQTHPEVIRNLPVRHPVIWLFN